MCGIVGIVSPNRQDVVYLMARALAHRGPDGEGYYRDDAIALGHRRLSIVDIEGGAQPIASSDDRYQLICNGEIYNSPELREHYTKEGYSFRTHTDVEVILPLYQEYGPDCVRHLRGMFAFAIWDRREKTLLLARDHTGQKPLFFAQHNGSFLFGSEPKAILASGIAAPTIDLDALWHYMSLRYIPDNRSLFKGLHKLEAGHTLIFHHGTVSVEQYWTPSFEPKFQFDEETLVEKLDEELNRAVQLHMLSDVPVGAFLSGGIDSSTVAAMMSRTTDAVIPSFTIGVQEASFNEVPFAQSVAERYSMDSHVRMVNPSLIQLAPAMIHALDEPADPFGVGVYLVSELAAEHVKVVLTGDGGDETYAGYDRYAGQRLVDYYSMLPAWMRRQVVNRLIRLVPESFAYKSLAQKLAWMNDMSFYSEGERYAQSMSFHRFTHEAKQRLWTQAARSQLEEPDSAQKILQHFNADTAMELVDRMLFTDLMTRMPDHLLTIADRMSMAHSLEARPVLIDYRLVEYAGRVPGNLKLKRGRLKHLLRRVAERYLPHELVYRSKQGFAFPIGVWLRAGLKDYTLNLFRESRFVELGIFSGETIDELVTQHMSGKVDHTYRLWMLINLELWYRMYFESADIESLDALTARLMATA